MDYWLVLSPDQSACEMLMNLPCKSNLVLLTDTEAGLVGVEVLNSFVGVSCCREAEMSGPVLQHVI